ncbi:uncharacterized protein LOC118438574 [Folsomia candida]|uniref:Uncharacterized protein n=1 Tax=Folsomia candida TaxID=158441 RepID=A0A226DF54_FOLCA|nr:uncharacterized protein LOC118438574 [Folsomia candida]OXA43211.1 hypothetical protein Fcan01_22165 [Folsomia candida]
MQVNIFLTLLFIVVAEDVYFRDVDGKEYDGWGRAIPPGLTASKLEGDKTVWVHQLMGIIENTCMTERKRTKDELGVFDETIYTTKITEQKKFYTRKGFPNIGNTLFDWCVKGVLSGVDAAVQDLQKIPQK